MSNYDDELMKLRAAGFPAPAKSYEADGDDEGEGPHIAWATPEPHRAAQIEKPKTEKMLYVLKQGKFSDEQIAAMTFAEACKHVGDIKGAWANKQVQQSLMSEKQRDNLLKMGYPQAFVAVLDRKQATALLSDRWGPKHSINPDQVSYLLKHRSPENLKTMSDAQAREAIYAIAISQEAK